MTIVGWALHVQQWWLQKEAIAQARANLQMLRAPAVKATSQMWLLGVPIQRLIGLIVIVMSIISF